MRIDQPMTIYTAAELKPLILQAVRENESPELDLSEVGEFDSAGLQLLLMARREAQGLQRRLSLSRPSEAVREVLELVAFDADGNQAGAAR